MSRQLAVVGAGLMGGGIAQVAAAAGWDVVLRDLTTDATDRALGAIEASYGKFVAKDAMTAQAAATALGRITVTTDLEAVGAAEVVVEAVVEDAEVKEDLFAALDGLCRDDAVLASNTSAIPITRLAAATSRPERVVGTHFFSPVPLMALCEVVRGARTDEATLARAQDFARDLGKTAIVVERDIAGFVTTRLICALVLEAVRLREAGVASAQDIDLACRLGFGHAMGPLATADLTGVDVLRSAALAIHAETGDRAFFPPELMSRMVRAGDLGRKTGRGFHEHG